MGGYASRTICAADIHKYKIFLFSEGWFFESSVGVIFNDCGRVQMYNQVKLPFD